MRDESKTKGQLMDELAELRQRVAVLAEIEHVSAERAAGHAQLPGDVTLDALQKAHDGLGARAGERTVELSRFDWALQAEVARRARAEQALERQRAFAQGLIESSVDGIFAFDLDCRLTAWNPEMERISGLGAHECIGRRAFDVFPFLREASEDRYFDAALAGRSVVAKDRPYIVPGSGQRSFFEGHYVPLYDESNKVVSVLGIMRDVTARVWAERKLLRKRRIAESASHAIATTDLKPESLLADSSCCPGPLQGKRADRESVAGQVRVFIAGVMQGSRFNNSVSGQGYRQSLARVLQENLEEIEIVDPWKVCPHSDVNNAEQARATFTDMSVLAGEVDAVVAYLPEASMGTAVEMWEAYHAGVPIFSISPMRENWVIKLFSSQVFPTLEAFTTFVVNGGLASAVSGAWGQEN